MVVSLSSMDIVFLIHELKFMEGAKLEKVFQQSGSPELLFAFHVPGSGKRFIYANLPNLLCLSSFKPVFPDTPPHFAAMLRKRLSNARLWEISQRGFERIIEMVFSTKNKDFKLIFELFNPGNIILTDTDHTIREVFNPIKLSEDRKLLPRKPYTFPPELLDPRVLTKGGFYDLVSRSDKSSIVKTLAIECSLGGIYAEEVVFHADVDKTVAPAALDADRVSALFDSLQRLFSRSLNPGVVDGRPYPFRLFSRDMTSFVPASSFNEAVASVVLEHLEREDVESQRKHVSKTTSKYEKIISSQQSQLKGLERSCEENQKKGELIYKHYAAIDQLLSRLKALRETHTWHEIKESVGDDPVIKSIDEHKGIVQLDLD